MTPSANGLQRTFLMSVLLLALVVSASQPTLAGDWTAEETGGVVPVATWVWTGPGVQIFLVAVPLTEPLPLPQAEEAPEPADDEDKNGVILEDGAPF